MKYLIVEKEKVSSNAQVLKKRAGGVFIYGVLKGDGYGLGLVQMAGILRNEGISRFAVADPADAVTLREAGFLDEEILVLRSTCIERDVRLILEAGATATVGSYEAAVVLNAIASEQNTVVDAHIEVDTGMGRYGFQPGETDKILSVYRYMPSVNITGTYTHFNRAFKSVKYINKQLQIFNNVVAQIKAAGLDPGILHAANSAALFRCPEAKLDAVRVGSAFLGRMPGTRGDVGLKKVGYIECPCVETRWIARGSQVGYGAAFKARRPMRIAIVPVGYSDGVLAEKARDTWRCPDVMRVCGSMVKGWFSRRRVYAAVGAARAPVIGHVGMQHAVLDVTEVACVAGDAVRFEVNPLISGMMLPRKYV